jgi:hypothetical protein
VRQAPETSGAANEVPDRRTTPPRPSDINISSPGATMKRFIRRPLSSSRLLKRQTPALSSRQACPGRLPMTPGRHVRRPSGWRRRRRVRPRWSYSRCGD